MEVREQPVEHAYAYNEADQTAVYDLAMAADNESETDPNMDDDGPAPVLLSAPLPLSQPAVRALNENRGDAAPSESTGADGASESGI